MVCIRVPDRLNSSGNCCILILKRERAFSLIRGGYDGNTVYRSTKTSSLHVRNPFFLQKLCDLKQANYRLHASVSNT